MSGVLAVLLIFASGCVGQTTSSQITYSATDGVIIKTFQTDMTEVYPGEDVSFELVAQNVGDSDASNCNSYLYGLGGWTWGTETPYHNTLGEIRGVDRKINKPGLSENDEWTVEAPTNIPEGFSVGTQAKTRVLCNYQTEGTMTFEVADRDFVAQQKKLGETVTLSTQSDIKGGPVSLGIDVPGRKELSTDHQEVEIVITMNNVGEGTVYQKDTVAAPESTTYTLGVSRTRMNLVEVVTEVDGTIIVTGEDACDSSAEKLVDGFSVVSCEVTLPIPAAGQGIEMHTVHVTLNYAYAMTASTSVTVSNI